MQKITLLKKFGIPAGVIAGLLLAGGITMAAVGGPACNVPSDYPTIQGAVNDAGCSTINVAAGTYAEHVTIARSLTLNGANAGVLGNAIRGAESVLVGTTTGALQLTGNNITVNGFKIMSASNALGAGIHMSATTAGDMIENNLITGNQIGIYANSNGTSTISQNLFDANNSPGSAAGTGIYSEFSDHLIIDNNEFRNHTTNSPIIFGATGSGVHKNLTVSNNWLHNNENASNIYVLSVAGGNFMGNTISASSTVTGISFSGDDQNVSVSKNIISGSARGIRVEDGGYALGANMNITISRNSLTGNSEYGVGNITASTTLVDAACNWWGAANGPGPVGPGTGDKVTTNVTFTPWLGSADLNGPCPQPPVTNLLTVTLSGNGSGSVTSNPVGISCGLDCTESYATSTPVTLTATSTAGSMFAGWSGACSGNGLCLVTMNSAMSVTATFTLIAPPPTPKPTNMNECKSGGWTIFTNPSFKNQGQCVSYVESNNHAGKK